MMLLGFLPVLICAGWVLVYAEPNGNWFRDHVNTWTGDIGIRSVVHDVATDPRYIRGPLADSVTALAVPIKAGKETVGAVDIESDEAWTFDAADVEGLQALASAIGSVVARSRASTSRPKP